MRWLPILLLPALIAFAFRNANPSAAFQPDSGQTLAEARKGFKTKIIPRNEDKVPVPTPPAKIFRKIQYDAPPGKLWAYITPKPNDAKKHPAIIWITGGDCNSINDLWHPAPETNDQTAAAYRQAGIVLMFPSLRGGNDNPGVKEGFLGEVEDILAAADFLAKYSYVDPNRIYLGGHSTGGTMVLLVAECTDRFRAVFSFGPVDDVDGYGEEYCPFNLRDRKEVELRSPGRWLASIKSPTFVFEGTTQGNLPCLTAMSRSSKNPNAHFHPVRGVTHFSILAPLNKLIAQKILADSSPTPSLSFTPDELSTAFKK